MYQPKFVHLRVHTSYSLSEGAVRPEDVSKIATKFEMPALAVADSGNLFGLLEVSSACYKSGVQLIPACEFELVTDRDNSKKKILGKLVVLAKNEQGFLNLLKISSEGFFNSTDHTKPNILIEELINNKDGLIVLSGGRDGVIYNLIRDGQNSQAEEFATYMQNKFANDFYIELNRFPDFREDELEKKVLQLAQKTNIPIVATNNVMFPTPQMHEAQGILRCIADGFTISDENRPKYSEHQYFKSADEMAQIFADLPEALENTVKIALKCNFITKGSDPMLPRFPTHGGRNEEEELYAVALEGLCKRLCFSPNPTEEQKEKFKEYFERLDFEVSVINKMKFPGYFLIVSDFIRWAKDNDIPVGPGRGSGAGSVVAWALQITNLDPIRFGLLFERFLNPERVSMPDFDIDFCQERRGEVINYVQQKYGNANVAQIITFGKLQARAVLKDVGRVLQIPYSKVDRMCKMIPFNPIDPVTLEKAIDLDPAMKKEAKEDESIAKLLDIGLKLEGMHRHASTHAAGVVIGSKPLVEILPLYTDHKSTMPTTQYAMKYCEAAGLVKFDFLGLKTLTLISKAVKMIKENEGAEIDIDALPLDDKKTFEILAKGAGVGVFQMESAGMRDSMRKMRLDSIEDIIALISLYRPGPMENIPRYIACKLGKQKPDYLHPMLEACLKETYGVIIYQEQVMQIAQILAGYSLGGADLLRRAMGKKIKAEMDAQRELFVTGAVKNNVLKEKAEEIFDLVAKFAGYGFNKSHAAAYAVIGYQTAYLKAHYPAEFFCASMNQDIIDTDKILVFKEDAKRTGIKILPPHINHSQAYFATEKLPDGTKAIRYALGALKGVGIDAIEQMVKEREQNGKFKDLSDFINRTDDKVMNKRQLESLTLSGAFDEFEGNRRKIYEDIPLMIAFNKSLNEDKNTNQESLFGLDEATNNTTQNFRLREFDDFPPQERIFKEFESIGFYLDKHPVDNLLPIIPKNKFTFIEDIEDKVPITTRPERKDGEYNYKEKFQEGFRTLMIGVANKVTHRTRQGRRFTFFLLSDPTGMVEINIFNDDLINKSRDILESNIPMVIEAEIRRDEGGIRIIAGDIHSTAEYFRLLKLRAEIFVKEEEISGDKFNRLKTMLANDNAEIPVMLNVQAANGINIKMKLPKKFGLTKDYFELNNNEFEMKIVS